MKCLLVAGIVYLSVVAVVLTLKPSFMFTDDGTWKEFGIGRNPATHTWMPFWLFAVLWALISYILVTVGYAIFGAKSDISEIPELPESDIPEVPVLKNGKSSGKKNSPKFEESDIEVVDEVFEAEPEDLLKEVSSKSRVRSRARGKPMELPGGYYVLNTAATEAAGGVPKYIYLGKGLPEDA
jgi:hypothetical protein